MVQRPRRTGHRIGSLGAVDRWIAIGTIAAFAIVPFIAGIATLAEGWQPTGDVAVIGLRSRDAWTGHAPLVGQPTTGEEFTGKRSNHPGPIEFWVLGLTTRLLGSRAGLVLGAALVNAAALAGIAWLAFRRGGIVLLALVSVALAGLVRSLGSPSLHDVFNSELATYPMVLALLAAWSVLLGDLRITPVLVAAASVAAQVHVAGAAFVAPLVVVGAGSLVLVWRRHPRAVAREGRHLLGALGLLVVLWAPVLAQELSRGPSNVAALWTTATAPHPRIGLSFLSERLAFALAPPPSFLRATGRLGFLADTSQAGVLLAALLLGGIVTLALLVRRDAERHDVAQLAALVLLATATSLVAGSGQPPLAAFRADGTRWLWVVSLVVWLLAAWSAWILVDERWRPKVDRYVAPVGAALAGILLVAALLGTNLAHQRDGTVMSATDRASSLVIAALPKGTYHLQFEGNQALVTIGPGIAYRMEAAGRHVRVDDNAFGWAYGAFRTKPGPVAGRVRITSSTSGAQPGEQLIAMAPIDGGRGGTIRVYEQP